MSPSDSGHGVMKLIGEESDYGSEIDDDIWDAVFSPAVIEDAQPLHDVAITSIILDDEIAPTAGSDNQQKQTKVLRIPHAGGGDHDRLHGDELHWQADKTRSRVVQSVESPVIQENPEGKERDTSGVQAQAAIVEEDAAAARERSPSLPPNTQDTRSPLQRFRTSPKKPLSVTDIISPAWCELQYWYSLTKYGRIRKTPAMKQGSKIHKEKEREVHTEVPVETVSKEDRFGLRLWNIITGLRTLRLTGLTRELEVLGEIDGEVIVGIIDEISTRSPDGIPKSDTAAAEDGKQHKLTTYFATESNNETPKYETLYLVDIKTRKSKNLPSLGQMRPTRMQLMMYHRLLLDIARGAVSADAVFARYSVDPMKVFSDAFLSALSEIQLNNSSPAATDDSDDAMDEALQHNTLHSLWHLMVREFAMSISPTTLSPRLTAEYRSSDNGELIGRNTFDFDQHELEPYLTSEMQWWRGQREARGVDIEEAYKCRICEFAEGCQWRNEKAQEVRRLSRNQGSTKGAE